VTFKLA